MPEKKTKAKTKAAKEKAKAAAKEKKDEQRRTAQVSRERLKRITKAKKHHVRATNRILKYGTKSFVRNTWLSLAAIVIMTITLIILSATTISTRVMRTAMKQFEEQIDISVYIKQVATKDEVVLIANEMRELESVTDVKITSPDEATDKTIDMIAGDKNITDQTILDDLRDADVILPWTLNIKLVDIGDTSELENYVNNSDTMRGMLDAKEPTYATKDREAIDNIASVMSRVELSGFAAAGVFAFIAILIVFNTIRMAIFNRKEEIYMMRLVGASNSFIIGPFLVEASLYGIISAAVTIALCYGLTYSLANTADFGGVVKPTFDLMCTYWYYVVAALLVVGILIGVLSALFAAKKYLKAK